MMDNDDKLWLDLCRNDWRAFLAIVLDWPMSSIDRLDKWERLYKIRK